MDHVKKVADIGCDHAYLSIYAVREKKAGSAIAMDVKEGPLRIAAENVVAYGMEDKIETRLSDGGKALLAGECDSAVMAGMGGMLIERILLESLPVFYEMKQIVLQPQSDVEHLREFLYFTGFDIQDEDMVFEDGKYYPMMRMARRVKKKAPARPDKAELLYGKKIYTGKDPVYDDFLQAEKKKYEKAVREIQKGCDDTVNHVKQQVLEECLLVNSEAIKAREAIRQREVSAETVAGNMP